jgi:hypothetical protein
MSFLAKTLKRFSFQSLLKVAEFHLGLRASFSGLNELLDCASQDWYGLRAQGMCLELSKDTIA